MTTTCALLYLFTSNVTSSVRGIYINMVYLHQADAPYTALRSEISPIVFFITPMTLMCLMTQIRHDIALSVSPGFRDAIPVFQ
jgi:hypothetical protein